MTPIENNPNITDPGIGTPTFTGSFETINITKCVKCLTNHAETWNCEYNFNYFNWLTHEIERVKRVLNIK